MSQHTQLAQLVTLSVAQQTTVDERFRRLLGKGGVGKAGKSIFGKASSMKASDWLHFIKYFDVYVFHGVLPEAQQAGYWGLTSIFRALLQLECNTEGDDAEEMTRMDGLSEWIAEGLSVLERTWPGTVITGTQIHGLLHFPRLIYRWNSVRNYWCFFNERYA